MFRSARFSTDANRYLIVGLGNPGEKYVNTRHNAGFEMLNAVAARYGIKVKKVRGKALIGEGKIAGESVILAKPQTFMNLSGESVSELMAYYKLTPEKIIIIFDDVSLPVGKLRIRPKGSAGGHNGMKNIIYQLNTDEFIRVRIGIGEPAPGTLVDYVLNNFSKAETKLLVELAVKMPEIVEDIIKNGAVHAMNMYN